MRECLHSRSSHEAYLDRGLISKEDRYRGNSAPLAFAGCCAGLLSQRGLLSTGRRRDTGGRAMRDGGSEGVVTSDVTWETRRCTLPRP